MEHGLELIIARLEILEIGVCNIIHNPGNIGNHSFSIFWTPGNIGNLIFLVSWDPGNIGNLSLQHSPGSWKYWKSESATFSRILEILPKPQTQSQTQTHIPSWTRDG